MDRVKEEYIRKRAMIVEMLKRNVQPDEKTMRELLALEEELRNSGYDPKKLYADFLRQMRERIQRITPQHESDADDLSQDINGFSKPISKQKIIIKPVNLTDKGLVVRQEGMRETDQGMEYSISDVLIIAACGRRVRGNEVAGRCDVCGRYECSSEHLFLCYEQGCKNKSLCIKCTRFLEIEPGKKVPYCKDHCDRAFKNLNTWKFLEKKSNREKSDEEGRNNGG